MNREVKPDSQLSHLGDLLINTGRVEPSHSVVFGKVYLQVEDRADKTESFVKTAHMSPHQARTLAFDLLDAADEAEQAQYMAELAAFPQRVVIGFDGTHHDELDTYGMFDRPLWHVEPETTELAPWEAELLGCVEERHFVVGSDGVTTSELVFEATLDEVNPRLIEVLLGDARLTVAPLNYNAFERAMWLNSEPRDDWFRITSNHATD